MDKKALFWSWIAAAAFFIAAFLIMTVEVRIEIAGGEDLISSLDHWAIHLSEGLRNRTLTTIAIDLTALGSVPILTLFVVMSSTLLLLKKQFQPTLHLVIAGVGAGILDQILKATFERPRPIELSHLVEAGGFSYPSGHSLGSAAVYFTFAVLLCSYFRFWHERAVILGMTFVFVVCIALSRVYLGVHYMSDVMAGMFMGIAWAAALGAARALFYLRQRST